MNMQKDSILENFGNLLVIDIETVAQATHLKELPIAMQEHWQRKASLIQSPHEEIDTATLFNEKAGIYAEYGKIVCIGLGYFELINGNKYHFRMKYIAADNEKKLLADFLHLLSLFTNKNPIIHFCGHNIKEFDIPYICRRMLVNSLTLPNCLQLSGKKPWEINHIDTLELWKFGDYKHYIALDVLAQLFQIPSPKSDIAGKDVNKVYWQDRDLIRIGNYCLQDVYTTAQILLKIKGWHDIQLIPMYNNQ